MSSIESKHNGCSHRNTVQNREGCEVCTDCGLVISGVKLKYYPPFRENGETRTQHSLPNFRHNIGKKNERHHRHIYKRIARLENRVICDNETKVRNEIYYEARRLVSICQLPESLIQTATNLGVSFYHQMEPYTLERNTNLLAGVAVYLAAMENNLFINFVTFRKKLREKEKKFRIVLRKVISKNSQYKKFRSDTFRKKNVLMYLNGIYEEVILKGNREFLSLAQKYMEANWGYLKPERNRLIAAFIFNKTKNRLTDTRACKFVGVKQANLSLMKNRIRGRISMSRTLNKSPQKFLIENKTLNEINLEKEMELLNKKNIQLYKENIELRLNNEFLRREMAKLLEKSTP